MKKTILALAASAALFSAAGAANAAGDVSQGGQLTVIAKYVPGCNIDLGGGNHNETFTFGPFSSLDHVLTQQGRISVSCSSGANGKSYTNIKVGLNKGNTITDETSTEQRFVYTGNAADKKRLPVQFYQGTSASGTIWGDLSDTGTKAPFVFDANGSKTAKDFTVALGSDSAGVLNGIDFGEFKNDFIVTISYGEGATPAQGG